MRVTVQDIIKVLTANAEKAKRLVARLARDFPREHEPCPIGSDRALDNALITAPETHDPERCDCRRVLGGGDAIFCACCGIDGAIVNAALPRI